jgi:hypothetical protein
MMTLGRATRDLCRGDAFSDDVLCSFSLARTLTWKVLSPSIDHLGEREDEEEWAM